MTTPSIDYQAALEDFHRERQMAAMQEILARFTGKPVNLLSYGEVSASLSLVGGSDLGLMDIPVEAIVGSVGRYSDFTRDFLPRQDGDRERWARVKAAVLGSTGVPPIEVYKVGDVFFVRDGHHRVSVARQLKMKTIQAYVNEIRTRVPLTGDLAPDELILKAEYVDFLEASHFDDIIPSAELKVTVPGYYRKLLEHIQVHRYYMGIDQHHEISNPEAVRDWYDSLYMPVVCVIREQGILRDFPGRTETDMYLWISDHRYHLQKRLGIHIRSDLAATHFAEERSPRLKQVLRRFRRRVLDRVVPEQLEEVSTPGAWRGSRGLESECLFRDLLVPLSGGDDTWSALDQAIEFARCDGTYLNGLHVLPPGRETDDPDAILVKERFEERCQQEGVSGGLAIVQGEIAHQVLQQAIFNDLVIFHLAHPPGPQILDRLESGLTTVIRSCARPILVVPGAASPLNRIVLGFDGSVKSREALFLAAYLAGKRGAAVTVVTAVELGKTSTRTLNRARKYLEKFGVQACYIQRDGPACEAILAAAGEKDANLILMGGYGYSPMVEMVLGSNVDRVLRESTVPVLICQ
jgi:nucleotide-binding universal stress UspA family protein